MNEAYLCPCLFVIYIPAGPRYIRWRGKNLHYSTFTEDNHCWHIAHREPGYSNENMVRNGRKLDLVVSPARQRREIDEGVGAGGRRMEGGGGEGGEGKKEKG